MDNDCRPSPEQAWSEAGGLLSKFFEENRHIQFVRLCWIDYFGISRARVLTKTHVTRLQATHDGLTASPGALTAPYVPERGRLPRAGTSKVFPDVTSLRVCHYAYGHAQMMCFLREDYDGSAYTADPRSLLSRSLDRAKSHGLTLLLGFETEFFLLDPSTNPPAPIKNGSNCWSSAGLRGKHFAALEEMAMLLEVSDIGVQQYHTENTHGFFEIVTSPFSPMAAVDALVYTHELIKTVAMKHGYLATVFFKPSDANVFAGMHAHISIMPTTKEDTFLAGILKNLTSIRAVGMPNYDSHVRLCELNQTTGEWVAWGTEFRDVPVRKISPGHWEIRCIDGTANMYLAIAGIVAAGCIGLEGSMDLTVKDCRQTPGLMDEKTRKDHGVKIRLPKSLEAALECLSYSVPPEKAVYPADFVKKWSHSKTKENETCSRMSEESRREICLQMY